MIVVVNAGQQRKGIQCSAITYCTNNIIIAPIAPTHIYFGERMREKSDDTLYFDLYKTMPSAIQKLGKHITNELGSTTHEIKDQRIVCKHEFTTDPAHKLGSNIMFVHGGGAYIGDHFVEDCLLSITFMLFPIYLFNYTDKSKNIGIYLRECIMRRSNWQIERLIDKNL